MNLQVLFLLIALYLVNGSPNYPESDFLKYNLENLHKDINSNLCQSPEFFIKMANIEESKKVNQNKIILYHGESYGAWVYQMILKAFMYSDAPEDWLPLRAEILNSEIDKTHLLRLINHYSNDHHAKYRKIGLSINPNLFSNDVSESAWGTICKWYFLNWHKIIGFSDFGTMHHELYGLLKEKFIPKDHWNRFKRQKKLLSYFIQERRKLDNTKIKISNFKEELEEYFPNTLRKYIGEFNLKFDKEEINSLQHTKSEGVALQIIMDKDLADQIVYNAHPYGWLKDDSKYSEYNHYYEGKIWENDEIRPYSEIYGQVKNHKDFEQARLALTNDFRRYPSRVRIKAIAGIMENPVDYKIVQSMIKEMVEFRKTSYNEKASDISDAEVENNFEIETKEKKTASWYKYFMNKFKSDFKQ